MNVNSRQKIKQASNEAQGSELFCQEWKTKGGGGLQGLPGATAPPTEPQTWRSRD